MLWLILGLLCALFYAIYHSVNKKYIQKSDALYFAFCWMLFIALITLPFVFIFLDKFVITPTSIFFLFIIGLILAVTNPLYYIAIKLAPISKTTPLLTLTPLFTLIIAMLTLKEFPSIIGIFGIILLVIGTYLLNYNPHKSGFFEPFKLIFRNKGSTLMFIVALIYGVGSVADKYLMNNSNPLTRILLYSYFTLPFLTAFLLFKDKSQFFSKTKEVFASNFKCVFVAAIIFYLVIITQMWALSMTYAAYIIAVKRVSAIFTVVIAYFMFNERKNFVHVIIGIILMVVGVALLAF